MLTVGSCVRKNNGVPWRIIEEEAILVEVKKGEVVHLNEVGAEVWDFLKGRKKVSDIIQHICDVFEVDKKIAQEDVLEFIQIAVEKGLVVSSDG